jgi:hypothetical protein
VRAHCHSGGNDHLEVADVDARLDARLAPGELHAAEVELERADPEPVVAVQLLHVRDDIRAVADSPAEVHVEDGQEDRNRGDDEREEYGERDGQPAEHASHAARVLGRELLRVRRRVGRRLARDPEDQRTGDQEEPPAVAVGPQRRPRQQDGARDGEETEADQRPRPVALVAERRGGDRVLLALVGDDERSGGVDQEAGAAQEGEDDEADAEDCGVDLEVASQAPADAGKHAVRPAALQPPDLWDMCGVFAHEVEHGFGRRATPSGMTLSRP